jgi:tRNA(Ile)-lysidine synthase TilS/MesJ
MALAYLLAKANGTENLKAYIVNHNLREGSTKEAEITKNRLAEWGKSNNKAPLLFANIYV